MHHDSGFRIFMNNLCITIRIFTVNATRVLYELPGLLPSVFVGPPKVMFGTDAIIFGCYTGT